MGSDKTELVFVPFFGPGHLAVTVELAKMMTRRDSRISVTIIIMSSPFGSTPTLTSDSSNIRFVTLPAVEAVAGATPGPAGAPPGPDSMFELIKAQAPLVRDAVRDSITRSGSGARLRGFVLDMFCSDMIDVADEFGVPSYIFFTSGAAFLGFFLYLQFLHDNEGLEFDEFKDSDAELAVPSYANPVPGKVFPPIMFDKQGGAEVFFSTPRRLREAKGIIVNTFVELESHAVRSFSSGTATLPKLYPVGPILNTEGESGEAEAKAAIIRWLDDQPRSSVVFLCFGSMGSFGKDQVKEIARGLERSGHRFLWALRQPPPTKMAPPTDYENVEDVLPEGFLDRTAAIGKVIGWAPQTAVLAHPAVGGFVSHCGWNSTLESIWYGVPVAAWPLYAEQQLNAFQTVKDLGLAVEIKIDYFRDTDYVVSREEIEIGLKKLMNRECGARKKREEMKKICREVMLEGGSSYVSLTTFLEEMIIDGQ